MEAKGNGNDTDEVLLSVNNLKVYFPINRGAIFPRHIGDIKAVDGVSFDVKRGETLGLVGESGCGKSTTGRAIVRLEQPTAGKVEFQGIEMTSLEGESLRKTRRRIQMIFQDPYASLNPRLRVRDIVGDPLKVHNISSDKTLTNQVRELLNIVGLNPNFITRYPHEFSGGQRQRIGIARALALRPDFIIFDEPVSALDVSIQAQIINLLENLQTEFRLTYLFIAHDLAVVRHISDRVAVMYLGKLAELTDRERLYENPLHPYTQALLSAVPIPNPIAERERFKNRVILEGDVPSPDNPPKGCNFCTRCPARTRVMEKKQIDCSQVEPEFRQVESRHWVACHLYD